MNIIVDRAVIEQALGALDWEDCNDDDGYERAKQKAITALRTALEQPQQEHIIDCPRCGHCCPQPEQEPVAIEWRLDGDKSCGYNNWVGHTPFGRILITWKGWKKYNNACVNEFPGGFNAYGSPDEVKAKCEVEFARRLNTTPPHKE